MILFGAYSDLFESINSSCEILFGLITGNKIKGSLFELTKNYPYPFIAWLYLYSFLPLFLTIAWDTFIFIIEDAYKFSKILVNRKDIIPDISDIDVSKIDAHMLLNEIKNLDLVRLFKIIDRESQKQEQLKTFVFLIRYIKIRTKQ